MAAAEHAKLQSLQGLRGIAILSIAISHCQLLCLADGGNAVSHWGGLGVELFILLSGFLSCYWHFDERQPAFSLRGSWLRVKQKLGKYYPLHLVTLFFALPFAYKALLAGKVSAWGTLVLNAALLQTWVPKTSVYFSYNGVAWFLSLMVFLVIVTPRMIAWLQRRSVRAVAGVMVGILVFEWAWALAAMQLPASHWLVYVVPVVRTLDLFLGGVLMSFINGYNRTNLPPASPMPSARPRCSWSMPSRPMWALA